MPNLRSELAVHPLCQGCGYVQTKRKDPAFEPGSVLAKAVSSAGGRGPRLLYSLKEGEK